MADGLNMAIRILYSIWFVRKAMADKSAARLAAFLPSSASGVALLAAAAITGMLFCARLGIR